MIDENLKTSLLVLSENLADRALEGTAKAAISIIVNPAGDLQVQWTGLVDNFQLLGIIRSAEDTIFRKIREGSKNG